VSARVELELNAAARMRRISTLLDLAAALVAGALAGFVFAYFALDAARAGSGPL
jgi:hypothetical protein